MVLFMKTNFLVIDLDNSLIKTDLFKEALCILLITKPWVFIKTLLIAIKSKAKAKSFVLKEYKTDFKTLPFDQRILDLLIKYKAKNYKIILATGASIDNANQIASHIGLIDEVIASDKNQNQIGKKKLETIKKKIGNDFIYIGDSRTDLPIWNYCKKAIIVGPKSYIINSLKKNNVKVIDIFKKNKSIIYIIAKQLRLHQWSKNTLIFVPPLASHQLFNHDILINSLIGFFSFSFIASGIYTINDILDLKHDREHPIKRKRPLASGDLSILGGLFLSMFCIFIGGFLSYSLGSKFIIICITYFILNLFYSFFLKKIIILDVIILMCFYTLRIIAGHFPHEIEYSPWLLSFSIFLFFSLGLLKRFVDVKTLQKNNSGIIGGRGYKVEDGKMLMSLGSCSGLISTLVLILYTGGEQVQRFYQYPMFLVSLSPMMLFWISRIWLLADRGIIDKDPLQFIIKDKISYLILFISMSILFIST